MSRPKLSEKGENVAVKMHVVQAWEGRETRWLYARCQVEGCDFNTHSDDPGAFIAAVGAHVARPARSREEG